MGVMGISSCFCFCLSKPFKILTSSKIQRLPSWRTWPPSWQNFQKGFGLKIVCWVINFWFLHVLLCLRACFDLVNVAISPKVVAVCAFQPILNHSNRTIELKDMVERLKTALRHSEFGIEPNSWFFPSKWGLFYTSSTHLEYIQDFSLFFFYHLQGLPPFRKTIQKPFAPRFTSNNSRNLKTSETSITLQATW